MASIWISANDQENRHVLPANIKPKHFGPTKHKVSLKKLASGMNENRVFARKQLLDPVATTPRSFGDISNKLMQRGLAPNTPTAGATPRKPEYVKHAALKSRDQTLLQQKPQVLLNQKVRAVKEEGSERDFFPVITEVEEYRDLLPEEFELQQEHVQRLLESWQTLAGPALGSLPMTPPPSPGRYIRDLPVRRPASYDVLETVTLLAVEDCSDLMMPSDW